jgi:hypothetical protein
MKLRIHKDSIRFRFTRGEVAALANGEALEESVAVGPLARQVLTYRVTPEEGASNAACVHAGFEENKLTVSVPAETLRTWHASDSLAIDAEQVWATGRLRILLEKDMQRLNPKPDEEPAGVYPNPLFGKARCDHP